jgi:pentatricopeptide repeat protein
MKVLAGKKQYREALLIYDRLVADGFKASPVTLSCVINFAAELGELDRAIDFFNELSSRTTPSIRAYMVALRVYSKQQDFPKSLELFRSMQSRKVSIDSLILNSVLGAGATAGKTDAASSLLQEVAESNPEIVDVISYNTVLKGFAHQKDADNALMTFDSMSKQGVAPNLITFNTIMDAEVRGCKIEHVWRLLEQMQKAGIKPDKYTCTILLKGLLQDQPSPRQLSIVLEMIQSVLHQCDSTLRASMFRGIIQVAARLSNASVLMNVFNQMKAQRIPPTQVDYMFTLVALAELCEPKHCSTIWQYILAPNQCEDSPTATAVFESAVQELAKRDSVEGMACIFESLQTAVGECEHLCKGSTGSQKSLENSAPHLLQQCRAALIQAASQRQHSSLACKRLLELAPEQGLSLEMLTSK